MLKITNLTLIFIILLISCKKEENVKADKISTTDSTYVKDSSMVQDSLAGQRSTVGFKKFSGAWFDIEYPSHFKAENSLKSSTNTEGFDSAVFTSPDGKVHFYVFSPQWSGTPSDIKVVPGEKITDNVEENVNGKVVKKWTVAAIDGTYQRSYEQTSEAGNNVSKIIGIKYASPSDLAKYRNEFLHFKQSLIQYAD